MKFDMHKNIGLSSIIFTWGTHIHSLSFYCGL
jgi:hypothetical protein